MLIEALNQSGKPWEINEGDIILPSLVVFDGINANNAQPNFIPSCENLIGINLIE